VRLLALLVALSVLAGCDRPLIDTVDADAYIQTDLDLSVVRLDRALTLRLLPRRTTGLVAVRVNNREVALDPVDGEFVYEDDLKRGVNRLIVVASYSDETELSDTLFVACFPPETSPPVNAGPARFDPAAATFPDGRAVFSGGSGTDKRALPTATILQATGTGVASSEVDLLAARTGHTATLVGGGILLLGGTIDEAPAGAAEFIGTAEWLGPDGVSQGVEIEGGLARSRHTTEVIRVDGQLYAVLYGGIVPAGSGASVSGTVDLYKIVFEAGTAPARLVRISPPGGIGSFPPVADHVQITENVSAWTTLGIGPGGPTSQRFTWLLPGTPSYPFQLAGASSVQLKTPRTDAAALASSENDLKVGFVFGGRTSDGETLASIGLYAFGVGQVFSFPESVRLTAPRSGHAATIFDGGRIVVGGGRSASGTTLSAYEVFLL